MKNIESGPCTDEFALANKLGKKILPVMLKREAKNGLELKIAKLNTFYALKQQMFLSHDPKIYTKDWREIFLI